MHGGRKFDPRSRFSKIFGSVLWLELELACWDPRSPNSSWLARNERFEFSFSTARLTKPKLKIDFSPQPGRSGNPGLLHSIGIIEIHIRARRKEIRSGIAIFENFSDQFFFHANFGIALKFWKTFQNFGKKFSTPNRAGKFAPKSCSGQKIS